MKILIILLVCICGVGLTLQIENPPTFTDLTNPNQLAQLNNYLQKINYVLTGRYIIIGNGQAGVDYTLTFDGETNDGVITWMEDEDYFRFEDDIVFNTNAGLSYGEIYVSDNTTETSITTKDVWVQCLIFDTNGESNNTTPDYTNNHITIDKAGKYMVIISASVLSGAGSAFDGEFEAKKNNGVTDLENVHTDRDLAGGGGDHGSISMTGISDLSVNDTIEVWVRNKTNTTDLIFEDITLSLFEIGG